MTGCIRLGLSAVLALFAMSAVASASCSGHDQSAEAPVEAPADTTAESS